MLFWHIGASVAFVRYAFRDPNMDLRFLAVGAILPDLIDLPIALFGWGSFGTVRLYGHSMLFSGALMLIVLIVTRRGAWRKRLLLLAIGALVHLALDAMWQAPETLWWPFLGTAFASSGFVTYGAYVADLVRSPLLWLGEVVGVSYLVWLSARSGLGERTARTELLRTGIVSAPIERS
jgi:membrane-bound metal-dependent hydrolase YbcI (DUF457 family)